jgi:hypothetical protein
MGRDAGQLVSRRVTHCNPVVTRRQSGEQIKTIDSDRSCHRTVRVVQGNGYAIDRLVLTRFLHAVTVGIQIDIIANGAEGLEMNGMAGSVVTWDCVTDGVGIGCVGNDAGRCGSGSDRYKSALLRRQCAHGTGKAIAG